MRSIVWKANIITIVKAQMTSANEKPDTHKRYEGEQEKKTPPKK